jgi:hypothetical protein
MLRRHSDGSFELIFCLSDRPIRVFGADEQEVFKRASAHLRSL